MIAGFIGKILSWLAGKGFLMFIQEALKAVQEERIRRDYEEALILNAKYDAEALQRAGADATRERMRDAEAAFGDDPLVLRGWLLSRDPATK